MPMWSIILVQSLCIFYIVYNAQLYIFSSKLNINLTCLNPFQAQMYLMTINLQLDGLTHSRHTCINPKMILNLNFIVLKEGEICLFGSSVTSTIMVKKMCIDKLSNDIWKARPFDLTQETVSFMLSNSDEYSSYLLI